MNIRTSSFVLFWLCLVLAFLAIGRIGEQLDLHRSRIDRTEKTLADLSRVVRLLDARLRGSSVGRPDAAPVGMPPVVGILNSSDTAGFRAAAAGDPAKP